MRAFADLLETLALTPSRNRKLTALRDYFAATPDPDRGYALAVLTGELSFRDVKAGRLKEVVLGEVDPHLFALSYDYVGDLGETIALIWPHHRPGEALPTLGRVVDLLATSAKAELPALIADLLTRATPHERWALVKLATGSLRIGVSARLAKAALSEMSGVPLQEIEEVWHGLKLPYEALFAWLSGDAAKPHVDPSARFHPMMLSNPVDEEKDFAGLDPADFQAEWKWDGIRVQLVIAPGRATMFSRTGDDISAAFPDVVDTLSGAAVIDGELLVGVGLNSVAFPDGEPVPTSPGNAFDPLPFNDLQQRLNRKSATAAHLKNLPAFVRVYDMLFDGAADIRPLPLTERRTRLEAWLAAHPQTRLDLSELLAFSDWDDLAALRREGADAHGHEGVMLKRRSAPYVPGRPKGLWFKWKRDPNLVDAVLMYAQRGHGRRSSYYSDYTFGVWRENELVPIGKAYFGFTDEELKRLDRWVRQNTIEAFGPVREVDKALVFEVAFDSAHESRRHKSGIALRFPRINRIRWDKPADEAARIEEMARFLTAGEAEDG